MKAQQDFIESHGTAQVQAWLAQSNPKAEGG